MNYKLENFSGEIDAQAIEIRSVNDMVHDKTCDVSIIIIDKNEKKYSFDLFGFTYSDTWEDSEVLEWAQNELKQYEV